MDRLTEWCGYHAAIINDSETAIDKLARYEDAEENGRLIVLPCNIGDTVYFIRGNYRKSRFKSIEAIRVTEINIKKDINGNLLPPAIVANGSRYRFSSIGKSVFLTREEAEKALEEMK